MTRVRSSGGFAVEAGVILPPQGFTVDIKQYQKTIVDYVFDVKMFYCKFIQKRENSEKKLVLNKLNLFR
jgi:hypothetical protein